jgi:hypothetical protein
MKTFLIAGLPLLAGKAHAADVNMTCRQARAFAAQHGYLDLSGYRYYFWSNAVYNCTGASPVTVSTLDRASCVVGCTANSDGSTGGGGGGGG